MQLAHPGAPFFYAAQPEPPGRRPALRGAAAVLFAVACSQLAERCGLPLSTAVMTTDATAPGWQASAENAFAALSGTLAPSDMLVGAGLLGGGGVYAHQQMVMDGEAFSWTAKIAQGIAVDDETIALETIREVGMGGNYLGAAPHARPHQGRLAPAPAGPQPLGRLGAQRQAGRLPTSDRADARDPRYARGSAARTWPDG